MSRSDEGPKTSGESKRHFSNLRPSSLVVRHSVRALSLTPDARAWLNHTSSARVLHVFDVACNLIDSENNILSLVTLAVGDGPFSLVVKVNFSKFVNANTKVTISDDTVTLGALNIHSADAHIWEPRPRWQGLHEQLDFLVSQLAALQALLQNDAPAGSFAPLFDESTRPVSESMQAKALQAARQPAHDLLSGIAALDLEQSKSAASKLAGLGGGLTPSGDDTIVGLLYAMWALQPDSFNSEFAEAVVSVAIPRTTHLSAAWMRAATRGEAGILWHRLIEAVIANDRESLLRAAKRIVRTGHTSGADALAGFVAALHRI